MGIFEVAYGEVDTEMLSGIPAGKYGYSTSPICPFLGPSGWETYGCYDHSILSSSTVSRLNG